MATSSTAGPSTDPVPSPPVMEDSPASAPTGPERSSGLPRAPAGDAAPSQPELPYTRQFSATSSWILNRLKTDTQKPPPSDVARDGGDVGAQWAQQPVDVSDVAERFLDYCSPSLKRKRPSNAPATDFLQKTMPFLTAAPISAPQRTQPSEADSLRCLKCGQTTWAPNSRLISCRGCHKSWHQQCLDALPLDTDDAEWLCPGCKNLGDKGLDGAEMQDRRRLVDKVRRTRLSDLPAGVVPAKPELVGFLARQASDAERTEYFYGKKRTDLLNILSLCDQLKPQLLVDVLVSVSRKHPDLPIFDDPDWRSNLPSASGLKRSAAGHSARVAVRPRHGHTLLHPKGARRAKGRRRHNEKRIVVTKVEGGAAEDKAEMELRVVMEAEVYSLPPTWPKAGEGLYAKLAPEDEDRAFLQDDNDEEAFSHFMVDRFGKQMAIAACA